MAHQSSELNAALNSRVLPECTHSMLPYSFMAFSPLGLRETAEFALTISHLGFLSSLLSFFSTIRG